MSKKAGPKLVDVDVAWQRLLRPNSRRRQDGIPLRSPRPPFIIPHTDIKRYPFKVLKKAGTGKPVIEVEYRGENKTFVSLSDFRCLS